MSVAEEVADAAFRNENSVDIAAAPDAVWPWLVQMGFGRAGWYSWDLIDNLGRRSATELHPEWMVRRAGEPVPGGPIVFDTPVVDEPEYFVISFGPKRILLWTVTFVLSYRLHPVAEGCALTSVATARIDGPLGRPAARHLLGPGDDVMVRKQLRGIRERAEALASRAPLDGDR
ncbi:MAG: hypothetical protein AAF480_12790 [Actinomycetota bacterium]